TTGPGRPRPALRRRSEHGRGVLPLGAAAPAALVPSRPVHGWSAAPTRHLAVALLALLAFFLLLCALLGPALLLLGALGRPLRLLAFPLRLLAFLFRLVRASARPFAGRSRPLGSSGRCRLRLIRRDIRVLRDRLDLGPVIRLGPGVLLGLGRPHRRLNRGNRHGGFRNGTVQSHDPD